MLRSEAIKKYLELHTHPDLAALYHKGMEVQLNVAKDDGERVEKGSFKGKAWIEWTNGVESWKSFRIPMNANSTPEDNDCNLTFNIEAHCEGIGMTGWDWIKRHSVYVAYDFDAMVGHSERHTKKLTDTELNELQNVITKLPYLTLRKSTSGKGLHLYIFFKEPVPTNNHTEHAALARALLSMVAGQTGYNFTDKVDVSGGNMWVWHRKMRGTDGLKLIKQGVPLENIPDNWREHRVVVTRQASKIPNYNINADEMDIFDKLCSQRSKVPLDQEHLKLINFLNENKMMHWWDADHHMLVTHTANLSNAHKALQLKGEFYTISTGREHSDINCFGYPMRSGAWVVRRYGTETAEHNYWETDSKGFRKAYFNRELTLPEIARILGAIELERKAYVFKDCHIGLEALTKLKITIELPDWIKTRNFKIKELGDNRYMSYILKEDSDQAQDMQALGWAIEKGTYKRIVPNPKRNVEDENAMMDEFDDVIRHVVSENAEDLGWLINNGNGVWREEPINHIKLLLKSKGINTKEIDMILGGAVNRAWTVVNKPFQPEYPGDRQWNRSTARFRVPPTIEGEDLSYPTWERVLTHVGRSLDEPIKNNAWCQENGISKGSDYLKLWLTCVIKYPQNPLPYLGLFGPQDSGKSTFHEAFCQLILSGGYARADNALTNGQGFNAELRGVVLALIEETNVGDSKNNLNKLAYNRLKDWVTSSQLNIHEKGSTPYLVNNYTHWIQCANERDHIPVFSGDTRVNLIYVDSIPKDQLIPKRDLWNLLNKEASDFLAALLQIEVPDSRDRLMLPVIATIDKREAELSSMNPVERFFKEKVRSIDGHYVSASDLYQAFLNSLDPSETMGWSRNKFGREIPRSILKGRISATGTQETYYANITLDDNPNLEARPRFVPSSGLFLVRLV